MMDRPENPSRTALRPDGAGPCLASALRDAARRATETYDAALAESGLKVTQYRLLALVAKAEEAPSISELARITGHDRSTLGRNLKVLERQGLLRFDGGEDERARLVALTEAGRAAHAAARPRWLQAQIDLQAALGPDRAASLLALLSDIKPPVAARR